MDSSHDRPAPRGLARDFDRIRTNGSATAAELREFMGQLRGKRPQEVMGTLANSSLMQCTTLATIVTIVMMAVFTVGPYVWNKIASTTTVAAKSAPTPPKAENPAAPAAAVKSETAASAPSAVSRTDTAKTSAQPIADPLEPSAANKQKALEKLGIGETKASDPKKNPLENSADDLLKDLK